jgi:hypothetical protein
MSKMETDLIRLCGELEAVRRAKDVENLEGILGKETKTEGAESIWGLGTKLKRLLNNHEELLQEAMNMDERLQNIDPTWK